MLSSYTTSTFFLFFQKFALNPAMPPSFLGRSCAENKFFLKYSYILLFFAFILQAFMV